MGMRRVLSCLALMAVVGCGGNRDQNEELGENASEIINGSVNTTHDAVVACFGGMQGCTGTVVHHDGFNAFVLTAAHCMYRPNTTTIDPLSQCAATDDYNSGQADWAGLVSDYEIHPSYDSNQNVYDFAMLRIQNVTSASVIPAMQPAEDVLQVGSDVLHVGFGTTQAGGGGNSQRRSTTNTLSELYQVQIVWDDQAISGPCSGDSGGPSISSIIGSERVAGVISFGDQNCNQLGVSGRVSAVYPWIAAFTGEDTTTTSATTTVGSGGATTTSTGVGGGGTGGASSSGSTGSNGWFAGDTEKSDNDTIIVSSCATGHSRDGDTAWWLALLGLAALRRRR